MAKVPCSMCGGSGQFNDFDIVNGQVVDNIGPCPSCGGSGGHEVPDGGTSLYSGAPKSIRSILTPPPTPSRN